MKIVFRTDASLQIGTGHVMRCLTLADALKAAGVQCRFICREHPGNLIAQIRQRGFAVNTLPASSEFPIYDEGAVEAQSNCAAWLGADWATDAAQTKAAIGATVVDWLIVDHYALDARWEQTLRPLCRKLMVIDDLANRPHDCDMLVDPGLEPDLKAKYKPLTPNGCMLFVGTHYAILRPEFDSARSVLAMSRKTSLPFRINVLFSGSDSSSATIEALDVIRATVPSATLVDVIVPMANQGMKAIELFCNANSGYAMHIATNKVAELFGLANLAIGSGGGATYERLYLRLPSILRPVAENQRAPLLYMTRIGLIDTYATPEQLQLKLANVFAYGATIPPDVVRNGVPAICNALLDQLVFLRRPIPYDLRRTFRWLQDAELRSQFLMTSRPERRQHFAYWRSLLYSDSQKVFSIYHGNTHIGNAGIKHIDKNSDSAEIWLYLGIPDKKRKGIGKLVLRQLHHHISSIIGCSKAVLNVSVNNLPAYHLYQKAGYTVCLSRESGSTDPLTKQDVVQMEKRL